MVKTGDQGHSKDGTGSPGHRVSDFGWVGSDHGSMCQTRCLTRFWVLTCALISWRCFYRVTPSRQTNIHGFGFGSVPVTVLVYLGLLQLVPLIFTNFRADCYCDVTTGSGRVKNPDPVPSLDVESGILKGFFIYYRDSYKQPRIKHDNPRQRFALRECFLVIRVIFCRFSFGIFNIVWILRRKRSRLSRAGNRRLSSWQHRVVLCRRSR